MARDPEMQKLVDEAKRERARTAESVARDHAEEDAHARPRPLMRFVGYWRMHASGPHLLWFLAASCFITLLFFSLGKWFVYGIYAFLAAFGIRLAIYFVGLLRGYQRFLRFPTDLAFPLDGWPALLDEKLITDPEQWQTDAELRVELEPTADREVIEAALELSAAEANSHFYAADLVIGAGAEPRKPWTREGTTIRGSINVWIIGNLYRVARRIDWIHRKAGGVKRIVVSKSGSIYGLSRPSGE